jgi:hypothetical protein
MKYEMTVKEMKEALARFHNDDIVQLSCGRYGKSDFAYLSVFDSDDAELATLLEDEN